MSRQKAFDVYVGCVATLFLLMNVFTPIHSYAASFIFAVMLAPVPCILVLGVIYLVNRFYWSKHEEEEPDE